MIRRSSRILFEVVAGVVGVMLLLAVGAAWRLSQGPVSLDFAVPYVHEQLARADGRVKIEFADIVLTWGGWDRTLDIRVLGATVRDRNGAAIADAPEMSVSLAMVRLVRGEIAPTRLELVEPRLRARRTATGELELTVEGTSQAAGESLPSLIRTMLDPEDPHSFFSELERVGVLRADLTVDDRALDTQWRANRFDLLLEREDGGLVARFDLDAQLENQTPNLSGNARYDFAKGTISVEGSVTKARLDRLAKQVSLPDAFDGVRFPIDLHFRIGFGTDGAVRDGRFRLSGGAGALHFPKLLPRTVPVRSAEARGKFDAAESRFELDDASFAIGDSTIRLAGVVGGDSGALTAEGNIEIHKMSLADVKSYWPPESDPGLHEWVTRNLEDGGVVRAGARVLARRPVSGPWSLDEIRGDMRLEGVTVHYLKPLKPVREVDASVTFIPGRVDVVVDGGDLNGLRIDTANIAIPDDGAGNWVLTLEAVMRGGIRNALEILDHPKLNYASDLGIDVAAVTGRTAVRMQVELPLIAKLALPQVDIRSAANLADLNLPGVLFGQDVKNGAMTLQLDKGGMTVSGTATLAQVPAAIVWYESFDDRSPIARRYDVKAILKDDDRRRLGVDTAPFMVGPVSAEITLVKPPTGPSNLVGKLILDETALALTPFGWSKPVAAAAEARFDAIVEGERIVSVRAFDIRAPGLVARGDLSIAGDGRTFSRANIGRFAVGDRTDVSGVVTKREDGLFDISISGTSLDGETLLNTTFETDRGASGLPPLHLQARLDRLWIDAKAMVSDVDITADYNGTTWRQIVATGSTPEKNRLRTVYRESARGQSIDLEAEDAGALLRMLNTIDNVSGGRLLLNASKAASDAAAPWRGNLAMTDFRVARAPVLARLLTLASLTAISDLFAGKGLAFKRLDVPFAMKSNQLTISNARAVGSEIGITVNGAIDLQGDDTKLEGTVVPAYTLNSLVGRIPLLGDIFTGGDGGGVFAVNFSISGALDDPAIQVNPLSALAPGILRNLLRDLGKAGTTPPPLPEIQD